MKSRITVLTALLAGLGVVAAAGALAPLDDKEKVAKADDAPKVAEVGKKAPDFELKDLNGKTHRLSDHEGKIIILEWFNPECPFVVHIHQSEHPFRTWSNDLHKHKDYVWFAINSGAPGEQGTGLEKNRGYQKQWNIMYPLLIDEEGIVGRAYGARTTPHMYVIDKERTLVYAGALDNAPMGRLASEGDTETNFVKRALTQLKNGETISPNSTRPYGCTVKYARDTQRQRPERGARGERGERGERGRGGRGERD